MAGINRVQSAYELLRMEQPHLPHRELWHQAQQAVMSETDPPGEALSVQDRKDRIAARTDELVLTEGLKWNDAWRQAETEFGVIPGSRFDPRLLWLLVGGFASVWLGFLGTYVIRGGENPAEPLYLLVVNGEPDDLAGLSAATALPAVLLFAVGVLLGASSKTQRPRVAALSLWVAGIALGLAWLGVFYDDVEGFAVVMFFLAFPVAFFGMLLGLVGLMIGIGVRLTRMLASQDVEKRLITASA